jgi:protein phosphatase
MRFLHASAQHIGARNSQEDSLGFADPKDRKFLAHGGFLAVLCDGMGGLDYGAEASSAAVSAFLEAYRAKPPEETIPAALNRCVRHANDRVTALAKELNAQDGVGTTLIAAVLHKSSLYYVSVGDSGLFHFAKGAIRWINHPHVFSTLLDEAVARGAISQKEALEHPDRAALTSFIGAEPLVDIDTSPDSIRLSAGDTVLIASDGLFNTLSMREIRGAMEGDPRKWADALVAQTLEKQNEYQDNVTVLALTLLSQ